MALPDITTPFRVAISGIVHTFRTQRHMRVHLYVTLITILLAMVLKLPLRQVLVLFFMISSVLVAEMFNSAIEAVVDLVSPNFHPLAKFAKDIAAGAVLIATMMAITAGLLIAVGDDTWEHIRVSLTASSPGIPPMMKLIGGLVVVLLIVVIGKGLGRRGEVLRGGLVSGHAAIGFFFAFSVPFLTDNALVSALAILLACIIAQSRYEAKIHSIFELTLGGLVGTIVALLVFGLYTK